mgnify:CR=1 FL=1
MLYTSWKDIAITQNIGAKFYSLHNTTVSMYSISGYDNPNVYSIYHLSLTGGDDYVLASTDQMLYDIRRPGFDVCIDPENEVSRVGDAGVEEFVTRQRDRSSPHVLI